MKAIFTALAIVLMASSSFAGSVSPEAVKNYKEALKAKVGDLSRSQDLKLSIHGYVSGNTVCGAEIPSVIATLSIKRPYTISNNGSPEMSESTQYETIQEYSVAVQDAETLAPESLAKRIVARDSCQE